MNAGQGSAAAFEAGAQAGEMEQEGKQPDQLLKSVVTKVELPRKTKISI
jgi:hypothetical protein